MGKGGQIALSLKFWNTR